PPPRGPAQPAGADLQPKQELTRDQPEVERLRHLARQRVDLLDGGEPQPRRARVHQPAAPSARAGASPPPGRARVLRRAAASARARASSSGLLTFMKTRAGSASRAISAS